MRRTRDRSPALTLSASELSELVRVLVEWEHGDVFLAELTRRLSDRGNVAGASICDALVMEVRAIRDAPGV